MVYHIGREAVSLMQFLLRGCTSFKIWNVLAKACLVVFTADKIS